MAFLNSQSNHASTADRTEHVPSDFDSSTNAPGFIANIVDVFDEQSANQQQQTEPKAYNSNLKPASMPPLPLSAYPSFREHQGIHNNQVSGFNPWQSPFRPPPRQMVPPNSSRHPTSHLPNGHVLPCYPPHLRQPMVNSNYSSNNNDGKSRESPFFGQLECNNRARIVAASSFASLEADTSRNRQKSEATLTSNSTSRHDMEGKKLAIAVSESPSCSRRGSMDEEEIPSIPDSPCPAFLSFEEMNDAEEFEGCFERQPGNDTNFALLPCLDDETGEKRISPPMMPCIGQSLSWEVADVSEGKPPALPDPALLTSAKQVTRRHSLTLKPKSSLPATAINSPAVTDGSSAALCQPLFHEHSVPFDNGAHRHSLSFTHGIGEEPIVGDERFDATTSHQSSPWMNMPSICEIGRDDYESNRTQSDGRRDNENIGDLFPKRPFTSLQQQSRRLFPPAISQSFSYSPVPTRPIATFGSPRIAGFPAQGMPPNLGTPMRRHQPPPRFPAHLPESKDRCYALNHPVPIKFQGDMEKAKNEPLPDFSMLVNFPNSLRQNRALPQGMRCCVMCGTIRPTCSRARNRQQKPDSQPQYQEFSMSDDFVTIPTQNKGLCTMCDVGVWVVKETGAQIKWCKGCKNFRQWAFFGEKGLATKCGRCRERQRSKYAKMKDVKKKQMDQNSQDAP